jgi:hypothetical protein
MILFILIISVILIINLVNIPEYSFRDDYYIDEELKESLTEWVGFKRKKK